MKGINERWNELENELGLGLPLNTLSEVDIANKWRLRALNAEKLLNQPQLTIPKSIADLADKEAFADSHTKFKIFIERYELNRLDRHLNLYCCTEEGRETVFAYMNPSTRDLVKVV